MLAEGIVADADLVDAGLIFGTGFAPFRGGPLHYPEEQSWKQLPEGKLPALRVMPMPADANQNGDIFGGWIMAQVDIAGGTVAGRIARGRVATVAVKEFVFKQPVQIGDLLSFYVDLERVGTTSITVNGRGLRRAPAARPEGREGDRGDAHLRRHRPRRAAAPGAARLACCSTRPRSPRSRCSASAPRSSAA